MKNEQDSNAQISYRYRFGTAEFDEARFELRVAGLPADVERRALEVLAYLLRHAGEVVTKEELFREVWAGRITVDKVLPNAIAKLRRALGEANADLLLTQPRIGYRLDGPVERIAVGRTLSSKLELAPGQPVPGRANFALVRQLAGSRGNEVWLAEHAKTHALRVYKFCIDGERLRILKREATLARVLQDSLEDRRHFVELIDWNFETPPFFLESEFGGENLLEWAKERLPATTREQRLELFLQVADAVAAAHGIGVLHKDLKPANVLVAPFGSDWQVRITDFGSGRLLDPERLDELGITGLGLTVTQGLSADSSSGTPLYLAPEVIAGHVSTAQSDVYALGILLYQMLAGDLNRPMASGWEADIADELLCDDIRLATHGNPAQRLAGVAELAARLRNRDLRREQVARMREAQQQARQAQDALARSRARLPYLVALVAALVLGVLVSLGFYRVASNARNAAQRELERANAINRFLTDDLINQSNPLVAAHGANFSFKDMLLAARERVSRRFAGQPLTEASIRLRLGTLFTTTEQLADAEAEFRQAVELYDRAGAAESTEALKARAGWARVLTMNSKADLAREQMKPLERAAADPRNVYAKYLLATTLGVYHINLGNYREALPQLRTALQLQSEVEPNEIAVRDSLRFNLIPVLNYAGQTREAREEAEKFIDELKARPEESELKIAYAKALLARSYLAENQFDAAQALLLEAQRVIVRDLGSAHSRNLLILNDLLDIADQRADWPHAIDYAQQVHAGMRAKFGDTHVMYGLSLGNLGKVMYASGDAAAAEPKLEEAYRSLTKTATAANPRTQYVAFWLAADKIDLGKLDEAERLLAAIRADTLETMMHGGYWTYRLDALRALLLLRRGDAATAVPLLQAAVAGMKEKEAPSPGYIYEKARRVLESRRGDAPPT